jgi:spectinomycin phosphotransferase
VHEPPPDVTDAQVLDAVRAGWLPDAGSVRHLPVGFGAHHWVVAVAGAPRLFATLDALAPRHTAASLEGAYAGAAELAGRGLEFVLASVLGAGGTFTVPVGRGALSVTPWRDGVSGSGPHDDLADARRSAGRLARLHAEPVPAGVPLWRPLVGPDLADRLATSTEAAWDGGPHGEVARMAVRDHLADTATWTARYHLLAARTDPASWVPTHGEPHTRNLLRTADVDLVVDWESLKAAPRERDLATLLEHGPGWEDAYAWPRGTTDPSADAIELFDLEWRLDEIAQYAAFFAGSHTDDADARTSIDGLRHELCRSPRPR